MGRGFEDDREDKQLLHLLSARERMKRLFDEQAARLATESVTSVGWNPSVDIHNTPEAFLLTAELPGVDESAIDLRVEDGTLILQGERSTHAEAKGQSYHMLERADGPFRRAFRLPADVDADKIRAQLRDGVLRVTLLKRPQSKQGGVPVEVGK